MSTELSVFNYQSFKVRAVLDDKGNPWFVAKDACDVLGISKYRDAISKLDDDEKGRPVKVDTLSGQQEMVSINESGLYNLIMRSNKPQAKEFRKWVTSEVLPSIRKTGAYSTNAVATYSDDPIMLQAQAIMMLREKQLQLEDRVTLIEHDIKPVDALSDYLIYKLQGTCRSVGALQRQLNEKQGQKTTTAQETEFLKAQVCEMHHAQSLSSLTASQYNRSMMWLSERKDAIHKEMWSKGLFGGKVLNMPEVTI
ncbi:MAG: Bro-N domain-containing protein [Nitrospirae bacterium]|nr:Bro-N domain-containing protein [Nitrospirota bacterium]